jgi:hypothetical protein
MLNQAHWEVSTPAELETPQEGFINLMVAEDLTMWGRLSNGTLHQFSSSGALTIVGSLDPNAGNIDYPVASSGDVYIFISAGTIGTPPEAVEQGEMLICITDSSGGAGAAADFTIYQINIQYATTLVAGLILLVTNAKIEAGLDDLAAVTTLKLYYLLQIYGLEWILTDEVRGRNIDGTKNLTIRPSQNPASGGDQNCIDILGVDSVDEAAFIESVEGGCILIDAGNSGNTDQAESGQGGKLEIVSGAAGDALSSEPGGSGDAIFRTGNGADGDTGGGAGVATLGGTKGGKSLATNGSGGGGNESNVLGGDGGAATGTGTGGNGGKVYLQSGQGSNNFNAGGVGGDGGDAQLISRNAGTGDAVGGNSGITELRGGNGGGNQNGVNGSQKTGGEVKITAGKGGVAPEFPGDGGPVNITGGEGEFQNVDGGAGSKAGDGGDINIVGGVGPDGRTISGKGGSVKITAGGTGNVLLLGNSTDGGDINIEATDGGASVDGNGGNGGNVLIGAGDQGAGGGATGLDGAEGVVELNGHFAVNNVEDAITANAAGGFLPSTELKKVYSRIDTSAVLNASVKLPKSQNIIGTEFSIRNDGANQIEIFAFNGTDTINGSASVTLSAGNSVKIVQFTPTEYYVFD